MSACRSNSQSSAALAGLLALPLIPVAYTIAIYRQQISQIQVRSNGVVVIYLFTIVILTSVLLCKVIWQLLLPNFGTFLLDVVLFIVVTVATVLYYERFERFVNRVLFGVVYLPQRLLARYAERIATSLTVEDINRTLVNEVLPSLLVREATIVLWRDGPAEPILQMGVTALPTVSDESPPEWIKLSLPLRVQGREIGRFLFGRRDPDDLYADSERFQAIADQTAIALVNAEQQANLQALYRTSIERQELERRLLALELHDDVLNKLALLTMYVDDENVPEQFFTSVDGLTDQLRRTIHNLRPPMLDYGLWLALDDYIRTVQQRGEKVTFTIPRTDVRYEKQVEQHLFRIVQQAIENALRHAQAGQIVISGSLLPDKIKLVIEDDGIGFAWQGAAQLSVLLREKHYGLVGMMERGMLISADLTITSQPDQGTRITVYWTDVPSLSVEN